MAENFYQYRHPFAAIAHRILPGFIKERLVKSRIRSYRRLLAKSLSEPDPRKRDDLFTKSLKALEVAEIIDFGMRRRRR